MNKDNSPPNAAPGSPVARPQKSSFWLRSLACLFAIFGLAVSQAQAGEALLPVTPDMLSGPLVFYASGPYTFNTPLPYGVNNNLTDSGWIWPINPPDAGLLQIDFKKPT